MAHLSRTGTTAMVELAIYHKTRPHANASVDERQRMNVLLRADAGASLSLLQ